jgi:hypothetical protein
MVGWAVSKLEWMLKEVDVAWFKVLLLYSSGEAEENKKELRFW